MLNIMQTKDVITHLIIERIWRKKVDIEERKGKEFMRKMGKSRLPKQLNQCKPMGRGGIGKPIKKREILCVNRVFLMQMNIRIHEIVSLVQKLFWIYRNSIKKACLIFLRSTRISGISDRLKIYYEQ